MGVYDQHDWKISTVFILPIMPSLTEMAQTKHEAQHEHKKISIQRRTFLIDRYLIEPRSEVEPVVI